MKVLYGFDAGLDLGRTVATLGNYDGVHLGHQAILKTTVTRARERSVPAVAITFDPVPKKVLYPETAPPLIQTLEQRLRKIEVFDIDLTIVVVFGPDFARKSPEEFVQEYLIGLLKIQGFVVGHNFSFGHQKRGNPALLQEMGMQHDFFVEGIPEVQVNGVRVSSTLIREMILAGKMEEAQRYLGEPFALAGTVVEGERLGGRLGIPTANLKVENEILPARGVYVSRARLGSAVHHSVTNVGIRPTVGGQKLTVESHLLNYSGDLYERKMELEFLSRLRDEMRFSGIEELKARILSDIQHAEAYFQRWGEAE